MRTIIHSTANITSVVLGMSWRRIHAKPASLAGHQVAQQGPENMRAGAGLGESPAIRYGVINGLANVLIRVADHPALAPYWLPYPFYHALRMRVQSCGIQA